MCFWTSSSQHLESTGEHKCSSCSSAALTTGAGWHKRPLTEKKTLTVMRSGQRRAVPSTLQTDSFRPTCVSGQAAAALIWLTEYSVEFAQQNLFLNISLCNFSAQKLRNSCKVNPRQGSISLNCFFWSSCFRHKSQSTITLIRSACFRCLYAALCLFNTCVYIY